jgi:hypothetical protein
MKTSIIIKRKRYKVTIPYEGCNFVIVPNQNCQHCGEELKVQGKGNHIASHDTYAANAHCVNCKKVIGELQVKVDTIFGLEEDERVLCSRYKVY